MTHRLGCGIKTSIFQCKLLQHTGHRITCSSLLLHMASVNVLIAWSWTVMTWTLHMILWLHPTFEFCFLFFICLFWALTQSSWAGLTAMAQQRGRALQSSVSVKLKNNKGCIFIFDLTKWWRRMDWYSKIEKIISTMIYIDESKNYVDYVMAAWWKSNKQYFSFDRYVSEYMILYL